MSSARRDARQAPAPRLTIAASAVGRGLAVLAGVLVLVTVAFESLADPARARLGPAATEAAVEAVRRDLGLDAPLTIRLAYALSRQLRGDLGHSIALARPVSSLVGEAWANTLLYAVPGALLAFTSATLVALLLSPTRRHDAGARLEIALAGLAAVSGVVVTALVQGFISQVGAPVTALSLREVDGAGLTGLGDLVVHGAGPTLAWALLLVPSDLRTQRAALGVASREPWTMGLRSRGLSEWRVAWHVFLHALPIVGSRALQRLPQLACGSVAVEAVFDVPGLGHLMLLALRTGDVALAQGLVLAMAIPLVIARTLIALGTAPASGRSDAQRPDGVTAAPAAARARESFPFEVQS